LAVEGQKVGKAVFGVAANFAVADSAGKTAEVFENYSETQNYLVDENSKGGWYYLETAACYTSCYYNNYFAASFDFDRKMERLHY
jgi:hypothetical protein